MPRLDPTEPVSVAVYVNDLVRRLIAIAATRTVIDLRTPPEWAALMRAEMERLK